MVKKPRIAKFKTRAETRALGDPLDSKILLWRKFKLEMGVIRPRFPDVELFVANLIDHGYSSASQYCTAAILYELKRGSLRIPDRLIRNLSARVRLATNRLGLKKSKAPLVRPIRFFGGSIPIPLLGWVCLGTRHRGLLALDRLVVWNNPDTGSEVAAECLFAAEKTAGVRDCFIPLLGLKCIFDDSPTREIMRQICNFDVADHRITKHSARRTHLHALHAIRPLDLWPLSCLKRLYTRMGWEFSIPKLRDPKIKPIYSQYVSDFSAVEVPSCLVSLLREQFFFYYTGLIAESLDEIDAWFKSPAGFSFVSNNVCPSDKR